ncbi:MAG: 2OG-Fe(II) oxygenase [Caulobacteraceae bacterium]
MSPSSPPRDRAAQAQAQFELAHWLDAEGRHAEAANALRQASTAGYVPAMTFLAGRLLTGRGAAPAPVDGVALMAMAAQAGGADANTMMATLVAAGFGVRQDWARALDHLQRAADLGAVRAQGQLRVLAGASASGPADWAALRAAVDLAPWFAPAAKRSLSEAPRVRAIEGFASPAVCDWLVARGRVLARPAMVFDTATGGPRQADARSNSAAPFDIVQSDLVTLLVQAKIAATLGIPMQMMEPVQVLHYKTGQEFSPHVDHLDVTVPGYAADVALRGQRIATFLLYLNDDFEGGETHFPKIGLTHRGRRGDAMYFANIDVATRPDPLTLHAGLPPTAGEKWLLSQWMRDRPAPSPVG